MNIKLTAYDKLSFLFIFISLLFAMIFYPIFLDGVVLFETKNGPAMISEIALYIFPLAMALIYFIMYRVKLKVENKMFLTYLIYSHIGRMVLLLFILIINIFVILVNFGFDLDLNIFWVILTFVLSFMFFYGLIYILVKKHFIE